MFAIIGVNPISTISVQIIRSQFPKEEIIFVDDNVQKRFKVFNGVEVKYNYYELLDKASGFEKINLSISFGEKLLAKRKLIYHQLKSTNNVNFPILKHDTSIISELSKIMDGNILSFGTIIGHNTVFYPNSVVWSGAVIEHDCVIGESCYIGPNVTISGFVNVGECTLIGSGAVILPEVQIGKNCIIGAGSVVTKNVPDNALVVGVPAKILRK